MFFLMNDEWHNAVIDIGYYRLSQVFKGYSLHGGSVCPTEGEVEERERF